MKTLLARLVPVSNLNPIVSALKSRCEGLPNSFAYLPLLVVSILALLSATTTLSYQRLDSHYQASANGLNVANTPPQPTANTNQMAAIDRPFSYTVKAFTDQQTPASLTYSVSMTPANNGLSFDANTRILSGKPSQAGLISVSISATDAGGLSASTHFSVSVPCDTHPDYAALVDLFNATNGSEWTTKTNWLTSCSPCQWYGVSCGIGRRVVALELTNNNLSGSLPSSLSALSLAELRLADNQLSGPIPASLGKLTNLQTIQLNNNHLSGSIPTELGSIPYLEELQVYNNQLSGSIPASLGSQTYMQYLSLGHNQLSGSIPPSLGKLTKLLSLDLTNNQLTGSIPASLGNLPYLSGLNLGHNRLSGPIPGNLGYAVYGYYAIDLSYNQLSGPIPDSLGAGMLRDYLHTLRLDHNQLTGSIPASLSNLTSLQELYINNNQLSGCLPASLSALCGRSVDVSNNPNLPGGGNFATFCTNGTGQCPLQPDLTLTLYARPSTITSTSALISAVVEVLELNNVASSGPIILKITKDALFELDFAPSATEIGGKAVTNRSWTFSNADPDYYLLRNAQPVVAGGSQSVGLSGRLKPGATAGGLTLSAVLLGVAGEQKLTNNTDADKIEYFP